MAISDAARHHHDQLFADRVSTLSRTDPDLVEYFDNFAFDEVVSHTRLAPRLRLMVQLAALIGCQGRAEYEVILGAALANGVTPTEAKEIVYHAVAYLGVGRVLDFLTITNDVLTERGVDLPLASQTTTSRETRVDAGWMAQERIVGRERLSAMYKTAPADEQHIQRWLTANCFGDHYTRGGLDLETRELLTLVLLVAQGGCDPQVRSHVAGNLRVGNDRALLLDALSQLVPYIGYPRTLNGIAAIDEVAPAEGPEH